MAGYSNEGVLLQWDDERDLALLDKYKVWICDRKETFRCPTLLDHWLCLYQYAIDACTYCADYLALPESRGLDWRVKEGYQYVAVIPTTEAERKEREPKFRKRIAPWIEDFGKQYHKDIDELTELHNQIRALEVEKADDWQLDLAFRQWLWASGRDAELHHVWMLAFSVIYAMFEDICKEFVGIDRNDRLFNDMLGGFDHKILQADRELFQLGKLAQEMRLEPIFKETLDDEELLSKLALSEKGKGWLQELQAFVSEYGWRTFENWDVSHPSWVEKPSLALPQIRRFMAAPAFAVDEARKGLVARRQTAQRDALSKVPPEKQDNFTKLMKAAQWTVICAEEHVFYTEHQSNALGRHVTKEIGKRFAEAGALDDPQDIYYLMPEEIDPRILPKYSAKKLTAARKKERVQFLSKEPELYIGDSSKVGEVLAIHPMIRSCVAPFPRTRPELGADLYGTVSTPGVVEGEVSVVMDEGEFAKFVPGNILVTVEASSAFMPLFNMATAVITDAGGILSHASILGREYGLPVVAGSIEATKKLKTGMKVRVDGDVGTVYILEK